MDEHTPRVTPLDADEPAAAQDALPFDETADEPISFALTYPERLPSPARHAGPAEWGQLDLRPLDPARYPAFASVRHAGPGRRCGGGCARRRTRRSTSRRTEAC
jgi:hypothetical protein